MEQKSRIALHGVGLIPAKIFCAFFSPDLKNCPESLNHAYVFDDWCDDEVNIEECNFDGGDCCGEDVQTDFCDICACLQ